MQTTARKYGWPLDKTIIATNVTKLGPEQVRSPPKEGVYIHGLYLEGASWDEKSGTLENSRLKQFSSKMPVALCSPCLNLDIAVIASTDFESKS